MDSYDIQLETNVVLPPFITIENLKLFNPIDLTRCPDTKNLGDIKKEETNFDIKVFKQTEELPKKTYKKEIKEIKENKENKKLKEPVSDSGSESEEGISLENIDVALINNNRSSNKNKSYSVEELKKIAKFLGIEQAYGTKESLVKKILLEIEILKK